MQAIATRKRAQLYSSPAWPPKPRDLSQRLYVQPMEDLSFLAQWSARTQKFPTYGMHLDMYFP